MYLIFATVAGVIGGAMSIWFRLELQSPGIQLIADNQFFNVLITAHGLIMVFFLVVGDELARVLKDDDYEKIKAAAPTKIRSVIAKVGKAATANQ